MANTPPYTRDKDHNWQTVSILVQGVLFEVPVHRLVFYSHEFSSTYSITAAAKAQKVYPPDDHRSAPVVLDVDLEDFRKFLKVIYPKYHPSYTSDGTPFLLKSEWLSVLKLTTLWYFNFFRKMAIECLTPGLETIEKILLGHEFRVSSWVVDGYREFIARPAHPAIEEGRKLGFETVMTLWGIRDSYKAFGFPTVRTADSVIEEKIYLAFESELGELRALEYPHLTSLEKQRATAANAEKERLRNEALLEEGQEQERRLQDAARRKRRRTKERSVSMNSKRQEELIPLIRPTLSLPMRPARSQPTNHEQGCAVHPPSDEDPQSTPTSSSPTHSVSLQQSPPCTPSRRIQVPEHDTPFFTPVSTPPQPSIGEQTQRTDHPPPAHTNVVHNRLVPQLNALLLPLPSSKVRLIWVSTRGFFRSRLCVMSRLSVTSALRSLTDRSHIRVSQGVYRLSFNLWSFNSSADRRLLGDRLSLFVGFFILFFLLHYLAAPRTFFVDERTHLVFLKTMVVFSGVVTFGGLVAEPECSLVV